MLREIANMIPLMPILRGPARGCLWVPRTSSHGVWLGTYEGANVRLLQSLVRPGMVCWDIGANVGAITLVLAKLVGPGGSVLAVEPGPLNATHLRRHTKSLGWVEVVEKAVSDTDGWAYLSGDGHSGARLGDSGSLRVSTTTLDTLASARPRGPDVIKLDIEGHELAALRGGPRLLSSEDRPTLVVEFHGAGLPTRDFDSEARELVASRGYTWRRPLSDGWYLAQPTR